MRSDRSDLRWHGVDGTFVGSGVEIARYMAAEPGVSEDGTTPGVSPPADRQDVIVGGVVGLVAADHPITDEAVLTGSGSRRDDLADRRSGPPAMSLSVVRRTVRRPGTRPAPGACRRGGRGAVVPDEHRPQRTTCRRTGGRRRVTLRSGCHVDGSAAGLVGKGGGTGGQTPRPSPRHATDRVVCLAQDTREAVDMVLRPQHAGTASTVSDSAPLRQTQCAAWYRTRLGRPVEVVDGDVWLSLTAGLTAFEVPAHLVPRVLERMRSIGTGGPAPRTGHERVAFLCDADDLVLAQSDMPVEVAQLRASARLVLPRPGDAGAWVVCPTCTAECCPRRGRCSTRSPT
ncbi:hypothetical protein CKY47_29240 [Saccharothrix yanglingensis]|uniref:Uncharacterized protein n=1 Tax=Saccharothrix yanglingensis TaxID=659496 RepID=A0ABU0X9V5_9PSEU|nr:hypothetical protein [Saccharothrix yanglingensis]